MMKILMMILTISMEPAPGKVSTGSREVTVTNLIPAGDLEAIVVPRTSQGAEVPTIVVWADTDLHLEAVVPARIMAG